MPSVAVLGGGISGLAAALRLRDLAAEYASPLTVMLFERASSVGGCIRTVRTDGLVMELGADSLLVDKPAAAGLLRRLGLDADVVEMRAEFKGACVLRGGKLRRIPSDFRLFAPSSLRALLKSGLFSASGLARAAMEPFVPGSKSSGDETLASFVTRRFGREVLDRFAQPLIGGIYSGDPARLSMNATLPQFVEMEKRYGSILRAMRAARTPPPRPHLAGLRNGVGSLIEALRVRLGDSVHTGAHVVSLRRVSRGWTIGFADKPEIRADAVVCALPAYTAATLLEPAGEALAGKLRAVRYNSIATVNLVYAASAGASLPKGTGFLVPYTERRHITAATFSSQKYPGRAPADSLLVRAFIGGALQPELLGRSDDELVETARMELHELTGLRAMPLYSLVARWPRFLPEYGLNHQVNVASIDRLAHAIGGLALAGSALRGVGIADCIQSGEASAESVFGYMTS